MENLNNHSMHDAIRRKNIERVKWLLCFAKAESVRNLQENGYPGHTPLHVAAEIGNTQIFRLLISAGADVNAKNRNGETVFYSTLVLKYNLDIVKMLFEAGADVDNIDNSDRSLLHYAFIKNDQKLLRYLINAHLKFHRKAANVSDKNKQTPLHYLTEKSHSDSL